MWQHLLLFTPNLPLHFFAYQEVYMFRIVLSTRTSLAQMLHPSGNHSTFTTIQFHVFIPHERPRPGGLIINKHIVFLSDLSLYHVLGPLVFVSRGAVSHAAGFISTHHSYGMAETKLFFLTMLPLSFHEILRALIQILEIWRTTLQLIVCTSYLLLGLLTLVLL